MIKNRVSNPVFYLAVRPAQIEKGDVNSTISVLWKIAKGYKTSFSSVLNMQSEEMMVHPRRAQFMPDQYQEKTVYQHEESHRWSAEFFSSQYNGF